MNKFLFGLALSAVVAAPAMAADMPVKAPPMAPAAVSYAWTGCYIGGHVGVLRARKHWEAEDGFDLGRHTASGIMGGGQFGCDWQRERFVFGVLVDGTWSDADGDNVDNDGEPVTNRSIVRGLGSISGRVGIAWTPAWLIYVTGGWAWERDRHEISFEGELLQWAHKNRHGWTIGFGSEYSLGNNWSIFSQTNYYNFGRRDVQFTEAESGEPGVIRRIRETKWTWRVGVNYRFGGAAPVAARF